MARAAPELAHPTARVLAVLELLQAHGRMSGAELARRVGVDVRTVRRYVTVLEALGIPLTAERGRHGAYLLVPGFKLPPLMFTGDEALALSLGLVAARGLGLAGAGAAAESARAKLERVMPERLQARSRAVGETVALDLSRRAAPQEDATLVALAEAARERRRVRLRYRDARGGESERAFDAYGVAHRGGRWYAVGRCHLAKGIRSFRLDRVASVEPLPRTFVRPAGFDVLGHLARSVAALPRAFAIEVLLDADLDTARREIFGAMGVLEEAGGGVVLRAQADDLDWFARELARLPFGFELRAPAGLRAALARHAEGLRRAARRGVSPRRGVLL